jgi:hypothetical protein
VTASELEHDLSLSHGTIIRVIQELGFHKVCGRWVPRALSDDHKARRMAWLNHLGPSLDYMLDAQKLPSETLEALLAFWQQHADAHCRAGASRRLTIGPAVGFEWRTVTASIVVIFTCSQN